MLYCTHSYPINLIILVPIKAPIPRLNPNNQPDKENDGIAEKNAPIVQPIPRLAEYPISTPPDNDCIYRFGSLGVLILNSWDNKADTKAPKNTPTVLTKVCEINPEPILDPKHPLNDEIPLQLHIIVGDL